MSNARLALAVRKTRSSWAALVVVLAGTISAVAAIAGLTLWVSIAAAVAAILGGLRVLQTELLVPFRLEAVQRATVQIAVKKSDGSLALGTAVHLGDRHWLTAAHLLEDGRELLLKMLSENVSGAVGNMHLGVDLAVVTVDRDWPWRGIAARADPDAGDRVKAIGWTIGRPGRKGRLISLDFTVDGFAEDSTIVLRDSFPPTGFSGAPVVELRTGCVIGVVSSRAEGEFEHLNETYVGPVTRIPSKYR